MLLASRHLNVCVRVFVGIGDRRQERVGVNFLGQKIWPKLETGEGEYKRKEGPRLPHVKRGHPAPKGPSRSFSWYGTFCQRCFGYFSQSQKKFVNNTTAKEHRENQHYIYTNQATSQSRTQLFVKSSKAQTNTVSRGGQ